MYYNYKKFHSIVLMVVVSAKYEFIMVDIGDYGRLSDGSVFANSNLGRAICEDKLNLPSTRYISKNIEKKFPFVFAGDEAFPLPTNLIKPYSRNFLEHSELIANYRISRARRIVENAFGICNILVSSF